MEWDMRFLTTATAALIGLALVTSCSSGPSLTEYAETVEGLVLDVSGPIEMARTGTRQEAVLESTRRLAEVMESHIVAHPEQWLMFHPMWDPRAGPGSQGGVP